jgi:CubicO group peptidase (beta-lactamase class C family)
VPFNDPRHSEIVMYSAADSNRFVLEQPIVEAPGTRWDYNGGTTQLLGALITRGSGTPLLDYAREKLFEPLSIQDVEWIGAAQSDTAAASGLRLRPRDLAKIGQLVLNAGRWNDRQLVPARWLEQSFQSHVRTPPMNDEGEYACGYQWGLVNMNGNNQRRIFALPGNGGQRLTIIPELQLVVVIMAGNYNQQGQGQMPTDLMKRIVMGNLLEVSAD